MLLGFSNYLYSQFVETEYNFAKKINTLTFYNYRKSDLSVSPR
jgi:hypothetical protein